jgi:hypothetical protein
MRGVCTDSRRKSRSLILFFSDPVIEDRLRVLFTKNQTHRSLKFDHGDSAQKTTTIRFHVVTSLFVFLLRDKTRSTENTCMCVSV